MIPRETLADGTTRYRLLSQWKWSSLFWVPVGLLFLGVFGPGFVLAGIKASPAFLIMGVPLTAVWLFMLWAVANAPVEVLRPTQLIVDPSRRSLSVRPVPTWRAPRHLRFDEVDRLVLRRAVPAGLMPAVFEKWMWESLHLDLVLRDGSVVEGLRNRTRVSDEAMQRLAAEVAQQLGVPFEPVQRGGPVEARAREP